VSRLAVESPNSITSICCVFVVQQVAQRDEVMGIFAADAAVGVADSCD